MYLYTSHSFVGRKIWSLATARKISGAVHKSLGRYMVSSCSLKLKRATRSRLWNLSAKTSIEVKSQSEILVVQSASKYTDVLRRLPWMIPLEWRNSRPSVMPLVMPNLMGASSSFLLLFSAVLRSPSGPMRTRITDFQTEYSQKRLFHSASLNWCYWIFYWNWPPCLG